MCSSAFSAPATTGGSQLPPSAGRALSGARWSARGESACACRAGASVGGTGRGAARAGARVRRCSGVASLACTGQCCSAIGAVAPSHATSPGSALLTVWPATTTAQPSRPAPARWWSCAGAGWPAVGAERRRTSAGRSGQWAAGQRQRGGGATVAKSTVARSIVQCEEPRPWRSSLAPSPALQRHWPVSRPDRIATRWRRVRPCSRSRCSNGCVFSLKGMHLIHRSC